MKKLLQLIALIAFCGISAFGNTNPSPPGKTVLKNNDKSGIPTIGSSQPGLFLRQGMQINAGGFDLLVTYADGNNSGAGLMNFPALDIDLNVNFENLWVAPGGQVLRGEIRAASKLRETQTEVTPAGFEVNKNRDELPISITRDLNQMESFSIPQEAEMILENLLVTRHGAFMDLAFATPTVVEGDFINFDKKNVFTPANDFCLEDVNMDLTNDEEEVDDFEYPFRILKYDKEEEKGSFVVFSCDGFQRFSLAAEYEFDKDKLVRAKKAEEEEDDSEEGEDPETVIARFEINATKLTEFIALISIDPFEIPGTNGLSFTLDSAYFDLSSTENVDSFEYKPDGETAVKEDWKGFFMKEMSIELPPSVSSFNGEQGLTIGGKNFIYDRGNGMTGEVFKANLLDIGDGNIGGWGVSIDSLAFYIQKNSLDSFLLGGRVYIPITDDGHDIKYIAALGDTSLTFALDVEGEYKVPFLGNETTMELERSSLVGFRSLGGGDFEPFTDLSGSFKVKILGGEGKNPEIAFPELTFEHFMLNDSSLNGIDSVMNNGIDSVKAGLDRMSFGSFGLGVTSLTGLEKDEEEEEKEEPKVNGFKISVKEIKFSSVKSDSTDFKKLSFNLGVSLVKKKGGISGTASLSIESKMDYMKLLGDEKHKAISYHKTTLSGIEIEAEMAGFKMSGMVNHISDDKVYGNGFKGGLSLEGFGFKVTGMAQFGKTKHIFEGNSYAERQTSNLPPGEEEEEEEVSEEPKDSVLYSYFFVDVMTKFKKPVKMGSIDLLGMGGGIYYNMDKNYEVIEEFENEPKLSLVPGESFSGATYIPKNGAFGFSAAVMGSLAGSPEVFSFDAELSIQFNTNTLGVENVQFKGDGYFMAKNRKKRKEAAFKASVVIKADFVEGVLTCNFAFEGKYPSNVPMLTASGQGQMQFDINPDDDTEWANFVYMGKPRSPVKGKIGINKVNVEMNAYVMLGQDLPEAVPLSKIHDLFDGIPTGARTSGGDGFAFGFNASIPKKTFKAGPIHVYFSAVFGMDASIKKYRGVSCGNTGSEIGMNGWYIKARAYLAIEGGVDIDVDVRFFKGKVNLMELAVAASIQAELPNPLWLRGDLRARGSVLGGIVSVNKKIKFEIGEKCEVILDPSKLLAEIKVISETYPFAEEVKEGDSSDDNGGDTSDDNGGNTSEEEAKTFEIWEDALIAFQRPIQFGKEVPDEDDIMKIDPGTDLAKMYFFPFIDDLKFEKKDGGTVECIGEWNEDNTVYAHKPREALEVESDYNFEIKVRWMYRSDKTAWAEVINDETNEPFEEVRKGEFTTGQKPEKMMMAFLKPENHFPGYMQKNCHPDLAKSEIHFTKDGLGDMFNETKDREFDDEMYKVNFDYVVRLTNIMNNEAKDIPITEKPGDSSYETLTAKQFTKTIQTDTTGGTVTLQYSKNELVAKNSTVVKFPELSEGGFLERGTIYKLEILGIPREEDTDFNEVANANATNTLTASSGVAVVQVNTELTSRANPFIYPEEIYGFYFRTSSYESLQQKVESLASLGAVNSNKYRGSGHPEHKDIGEIPWDMRTETTASKEEDFKIADVYHVYKIDEGFDGWEREQLKLNLVYEQKEPEEYDDLPFLKQVVNDHKDRKLPDFWKEILNPEPWKVADWMYEIDFPKLSTTEERAGKDADGNLDGNRPFHPGLTYKEVIDKQVAAPTSKGKASNNEGKFTMSARWDLALVSKRRRVLQHQVFTISRIYSHLNEWVFDHPRPTHWKHTNRDWQKYLYSRLFNRRHKLAFCDKGSMLPGGIYWDGYRKSNTFNEAYNSNVPANGSATFKFHFDTRKGSVIQENVGKGNSIDLKISDKTKLDRA